MDSEHKEGQSSHPQAEIEEGTGIASVPSLGQQAPLPPSPPNPQARLRDLLSIPERQRTDAQWDEIIEIEITMGPRKSQVNSGKSSGNHQGKGGGGKGQARPQYAGQPGGQGGGRQNDKRPVGAGNKYMRNKRRSSSPQS